MKSKKNIPANIDIKIASHTLHVSMSLPDRAVPLRELLPTIQQITHKIIDIAVLQSEANGKTVSCKKGCGACCRQLVPITKTESWHIAKLVAKLPKEKQKRIKQSFREARETLQNSSLWEQLSSTTSIENTREIGFDYFDLDINCPFLEDNACSIHPHRPLSCREFLATSNPAFCSAPREMKIESIDIPVRASNTLGRIEDDEAATAFEWIPLSLALNWGSTHDEPEKQAATRWMEKFFQALSG